MTNQPAPPQPPLFLGIEGGGTHSVALLADAQGKLLQRKEAEPANLRLSSDSQMLRVFRQIAVGLPIPAALCVALPGAREEKDRQRIRRLVNQVWKSMPCHAANDLESALVAAGSNSRQTNARVLVLSGTGSCCFGQSPDGRTVKIGGWGHILGDKGSGHEIGLRALKAVVYYLDRDGEWSRLGQRILRALQLNEPNDLIDWVQSAGKKDVAALTVEVFTAWGERDKIAADILAGAAHSLARDAVSCAERLARPGERVEFVFNGSVLLRQPRFQRLLAREIKRRWKNARCVPLRIESAWGAVALARQEAERTRQRSAQRKTPPAPQKSSPRLHVESVMPHSSQLSPTEQRNPRSMNLHKLSLREGIELMLSEEAKIPRAILAEAPRIERTLRLILRAFENGGRLFYAGAGTSGRLGVLDASECPPTFRTPSDLVQGIIAGGKRALWQAVEGAEDDAEAGAQAIKFRGITRRDVVVGIAASGRTPFVWGALTEAKSRRAATVLICFNPFLEIPRERKPSVIICPRIGPEVLTGSTRLKAGTATKQILNILTTLAMVRLGKVISNLMVDLNPSNKKLRDRAVRILCELTGCEASHAKDALEHSGWIVKEAHRRLLATKH